MASAQPRCSRHARSACGLVTQKTAKVSTEEAKELAEQDARRAPDTEVDRRAAKVKEREDKLAEIDDLLDEIDGILTEETDFLATYTQRGGQ